MDYRNIVTLVLFSIVGIVLVSSFVPAIVGIQEVAGDKTTVENTGVNTLPITYWNGEEMDYEWDYTNKVLTLNDEPLSLTANQMLFSTSTFAIWTRANSTARLAALGDVVDVTNSDFSVVIGADGSYTLTRGSTVYEGTISWGLYQDENGTANLVQGTRSSAGYKTSTSNDVIILGNLYSTGENDTYYSYYNGELVVDEQYIEESSVVLNKTLLDGYTDIYATTVTVNVGDESFTPYYAVVPKTVSGHESSGAMYDIFGMLPLVAGLGLLLLICIEVFRRYY